MSSDERAIRQLIETFHAIRIKTIQVTAPLSEFPRLRAAGLEEGYDFRREPVGKEEHWVARTPAGERWMVPPAPEANGRAPSRRFIPNRDQYDRNHDRSPLPDGRQRGRGDRATPRTGRTAPCRHHAPHGGYAPPCALSLEEAMKPMQTTVTLAGHIAHAKANRLLDDANPELQRLALGALSQGSSVAFMITDPNDPIAPNDAFHDATRAKMAALRELAAGKPLVAVLPVGVICSLLAIVDGEPGIGQIIARLGAPRAPGSVPVVYTFGGSFGIVDLMTGHAPATVSASSELELGPEDAKPNPDGEGYILSLSGALKVLFNTALDEVQEGAPRERIGRFQERARGLLTAESIRAKPRPAGEVLIAGFGGDKMRAEWKADRFIEQIDRVLARSIA